MHKSDTKEYIEIDVLLILKKIFAKKFLILFFMIIGIFIIHVYSTVFQEDKYSVYMKLYVLNKSGETDITIQDLQLGNYLVKDYKEIIMSGDVLNKVISKGELNISEKDFRKKLEISMPMDTRVMSVKYTDSDPDRAYKVIRILQREAIDQIEKITSTKGVELIETPKKPLNPDSKNMSKKYLAVALSVLLLSCFSIAMMEVLNDKVNGPDDIEDTMQLPLLGVMPCWKSKAAKRKVNRYENRRYFKK